MRWHSRPGSVVSALLIGAVLLLPARALPWGWAAHVYLMENLGPTDEHGLYGAVLPDFAQVMSDPEALYFLQSQTHEKFDRLVDKVPSFGLGDLGAGFLSHNQRFGADYTAHVAGNTNPLGTGGYVVYKSQLLAQQPLPFPGGTATIAGFLENLLALNGLPAEDAAAVAAQVAPEAAHSVVEDVVDLLLQQAIDPMAGCLLLQAAQARDADAVQGLLVKSYAKNFAARFKLPRAEAEGAIVAAETGFQELMSYYGAILCPAVAPFDPWAQVAGLDAVRLNEFIKTVTGLPELNPEVTPWDAAAVLTAVPPLVAADFQAELAATLAGLLEGPAAAP